MSKVSLLNARNRFSDQMSVVGHDPGVTLCVGLWYGEEGDGDVDRKLLNSCKPSIRIHIIRIY